MSEYMTEDDYDWADDGAIIGGSVGRRIEAEVDQSAWTSRGHCGKVEKHGLY